MLGNITSPDEIRFDPVSRAVLSEFSLGVYESQFDLGVGDKEVEIFFPWSVSSTVKTLGVDDGAYVTPIKRKKKLLIYGDSIAYGSCSFHNSLHYVARLADRLNAEVFNKGVGREIFCPELLAEREDIDPDYIIVAYGTNSIWTKEEIYKKQCKKFLETITSYYPKAKMIVITPIWRSECEKVETFEKLKNIVLH